MQVDYKNLGKISFGKSTFNGCIFSEENVKKISLVKNSKKLRKK